MMTRVEVPYNTYLKNSVTALLFPNSIRVSTVLVPYRTVPYTIILPVEVVC